ncbi:MAG: serine/threonine protein kinase, partial [Marmoricola sp.]|nr:serine/threonine protein kinase [Marmoricola sp.]
VTSLRRIHSPRVAEILDADPHGPLPYVVTRYVPGLSLHHHVKEEGVIRGPALLHFARVLAEGLQAVHAAGVLHRDVKPTNVLMEGRWPVLIDFGLARVAEDPRLTQTGFLLGTPGYLAPEILYGDDASPASDVHSWAATVTYAANGRSPYGTGPTMAVLDRVRRGEHDLGDVTPELRPLLERSLAAEPTDRPALGELLEELRRLEAPTPRAAAPVVAEPVPWTMPFSPSGPSGAHARQDRATVVAPLPGAGAGPDRTVPSDVVGLRARQVDPYEQPDPPTTVLPAPVPAARADPGRQVPSAYPPAPSAYAPVDPGSRTQQRLQHLGLGALAGATVAYAPYLGLGLVALVVLGLRTVSVARQRHGRRRMLRGRSRWYDVPVTTLGTPGYVAVAAVGTVGLVVLAALVALALFSVGYLAGQPVAVGLTLAGLGFAPALWWGPGSDRLVETVRRSTTATSRSEWWGWFVAGTSTVLAAVLLALLFGSGPNWAPGLHAPWR